ncbi:hypothetical protein FGIG_10432 [Fasciola gigantica]|uniref:Uncharacterized protein n=1 Tax=Fasciola gigantica TaxID=46835 RepID=A0A504YS03_FASGI|nr:hypothetical protein FGIG_10432 [Fasciola gigantica]
MAPRTQPLHRKNSLTTANGDGSLALVLEDYEVFEAEAAELSIEEVDDFSSSLLLDVENATTSGGAYGGHEMCELATLVTRNFHPVLSAHSLATTSVVTPTHHAHTAEYKLLTVTGNSRLPGAAAPHLGVDSHVPRSDGVEWNGFGHEAPYLPVHMLAAVSHGGHPCLPSSWPEQLLAYTDAPALVNAIRSDLIAVCNRLHQTSSIHVIPCDRAPGLTTCQLTCCEASVEWCSTEYGVGAAAEATAATGPSTSVDQIDRKRTFTPNESLPIWVRNRHLNISEGLSAGIFPFSGLRPENLCNSSAFTAVYMLLIQDDTTHRHHHQVPSAFMRSVVEPGNCQLPEPRLLDSPFIWVTLVSLVPWCSGRFVNTGTILSSHRVIPPGCPDPVTLSKRDADQRLVTLLALVDVIGDTDENGLPISRVIIHQRLHHLPQLIVHWECA